MPLCTVADIKLAARIDGDITDHDAVIPDLIDEVTEIIESRCRVPAGWFDQVPRPPGWRGVKRCCIAVVALLVHDAAADIDALLGSAMLDGARHYGAMPALTSSVIPDGALAISSGVLSISAGLLVLSPAAAGPTAWSNGTLAISSGPLGIESGVLVSA